MTRVIVFEEAGKEYWIKKVNYLCGKDGVQLNKSRERSEISIEFSSCITILDFTHVHIVLFACLIERLKCLNYTMTAFIEDKNLRRFIFDELHVSEYYTEGESSCHVEADSDSIFNIWKIDPLKAEEYSMSVTNYFKRNYFKNRDLSGLKNSLDEVYFNVSDHAEAKGIAFSYIYFDQQNRQICVAACDLGLGIPYTLRRSGLEYKSDGEALRQSLEIGVSAKTNKHNKGFGLDNVVSNLSNKDRLRIVSNKALLLCHPNKNPIKFYELNFDFKGTLIYFEISIDSFLEEETLFDISLG